jgi:uncharacterized membrane protein
MSEKITNIETRNTMKQTATTLAIVMVFALAATLVIAAPQDAQSAAGTAETYTVTGANAYSAEGGNITEVNVSSDASTSKWQGFWGNISGSLRLGDGTSNIFYDWSGITFQAVYASPGTTLNWATVSDLAGQGAREGKDTDYNLTSTDPDSINQTMSGAACSAGTIFTNADGVTPYNSTAGAGSWETCLGEDTSNLAGTVFGTDVISAGADAFNGDTVQYQLMVPVEEAGTNYYFYLEI